LKELRDLWWQEAERNRVLPLLGGFTAFWGIQPPTIPTPRYNFAGDVQNVSTTMIPAIYGRSYTIEADVHVPEDGAEGVLVAFADFIGGFALWVDEKGHLNHTYQFLGVDTYKQTSTKPIPTGDVKMKMVFEIERPVPGSGGKVTLWANDQQIGEGTMPHTVAMLFTTYAGMDIGRDNGGVVDLAYEKQAPYAFTGKVKKVCFDLK
jgi:arylsulfatase